MESNPQSFAYAKIILLGEHAVVHGQPALAAALSSGVKAVAHKEGGPRVTASLWDFDVVPDLESSNPLERALGALFMHATQEARNAKISLAPDVPNRAGLGSSAAMSVALVRTLATLGQEFITETEIEQRAGIAEEIFHGKASGIDVAVSARGGILRFRKGESPTMLYCPEIPVVVAWIEPRTSTRIMVEKVGQAFQDQRQRTGLLFEKIGGLVEEAQRAIKRNDFKLLGELMTKNHNFLDELGVSTPLLDKACMIAQNAGAYGAKLTGAGGGGCIVALTPEHENEVAEALQSISKWVQIAKIGLEHVHDEL